MSSTRLFAAAAVAAAIAIPFLAAPDAGAEGPKTAPAKPGATTLEQVEKAMLVKRYEAVLAYAKANPSAPDAEEAGKRVVDLAQEAGLYDRVVAHADEFAAAHAGSKGLVDVRLAKADALANLDRVPDAKKAYKAALDGLDKEAHGLQTLWNAWSSYAQMLADAELFDEAKAAYEQASAEIDHPQVAKACEQSIARIEKQAKLIGSEPTAFPGATKDLDGKPLSLADYKGKVLLVDFWATWCPPCRAEIPNIVAAYRKWHDRGFEVLGISLDATEDEAELRKYMKDNEMPWRQFFDGKRFENELAQLYEVEGIPHTLLIKDGKIVKVGLRGEALERALAKLLK
jgi:thiol-disulfide isomerase/thioredoxin